jgi:uncharacterized membrane protein
MKQDYLRQLEDSLRAHQIVDADIEDVLNDYTGLYDDALDRGLTDEETADLLGKPDTVVRELLDTLRVRDFKEVRRRNNKLVALAPFIAVIAFMLLGFLGDLWHPGWLVFLFIPIAGILGNVNRKEKFVALSPFIAVITFIFIGISYDAWHPGWLIFLIVPIAGVFTGARKTDQLLGAMPFLALIACILLGTYLDAWEWSWLFFLLIPVIAALKSGKTLERFLLVPSILLAVGFYLFMYLHYDMLGYGLIGFALPAAIAVMIGSIRFDITFSRSFKGVTQTMIVLVCLAAFLIIGFTVTDAWGWAWMILLLIPVTSILIGRRRLTLTPIMPFVSVIVFFSLGYFFNLWHIAWLAFLLIPMMGIIENK